jgi:hypothetical protein
MYNNPSNLPLLSNPVGIDLPIQELQQELATFCPWIEYVFGRAWMGMKQQNSEPNYLYPAVYSGGKDYYDASPNDNIVSQSFFYIDGDHRVNSSEYEVGEYLKLSAPVSLIIWGNMEAINDAYGLGYNDEKYTHVLLQNVLNTIRKNRAFTINRISDNDRNVFTEFSIRTKNNRMFYYPYFCYRIKMDVAYEEECDYVEPVLNTLNAPLDFPI